MQSLEYPFRIQMKNLFRWKLKWKMVLCTYLSILIINLLPGFCCDLWDISGGFVTLMTFIINVMEHSRIRPGNIFHCVHSLRATPRVHCTVYFGWRNIKTCRFGLAKWFWPSFFHRKGWENAQHSLTPVVDWLDGLIGPGGLPSKVSQTFCSLSFQFYRQGWVKANN
jgi:hypothetical protein